MKTKTPSLLARFGVSALIVLLAGCSDFTGNSSVLCSNGFSLPPTRNVWLDDGKVTWLDGHTNSYSYYVPEGTTCTRISERKHS